MGKKKKYGGEEIPGQNIVCKSNYCEGVFLLFLKGFWFAFFVLGFFRMVEGFGCFSSGIAFFFILNPSALFMLFALCI